MLSRVIVLLTLLVLMGLAVCPVSAQLVPSEITYQGKLTTPAGTPVPDGSYTVVFKLFSGETGGEPLWTSPSINVNTSGGVFSARLTNIQSSTFTSDNAWLEVTVGSDSPMPRVKLGSVPYSLRAGDIALPLSRTLDTSSSVLTLSNIGLGRTAFFQIGNASNPSQAVYGMTIGSGAALFGLSSSTGQGVFGQCSGAGDAVRGYSTGTGRAGLFEINNIANTSAAIYGTSVGTGNAGYFKLTNTTNASAAVQAETTGLGSAGLFTVTNVTNASPALSASTTGVGAAVVGTVTGSGDAIRGLATGTGRGGSFVVSNTNNAQPAIYAESNGTGYAARVLLNNAASANHAMLVQTTGSGSAFYAWASGTGRAATFRGNVQLISKSTGTSVMELGEGLDYAEGFHVSDKANAKPGTVLVIDPKNPGKLAVSTKPYDKKVAGIIAGANNLGSGVRLGAGQFDHDVALAGRVYCNVDATKYAVEPGDMLTTSATPGYAMKAADHKKATGAILGKAMESLPKGKKGQILVLVTLQ